MNCYWLKDERMEYILKNEDAYDHYATHFEKSNKKMHVGKLGFVESHARKCAADLCYKATGASLPSYETIAPTSLPTITPTSHLTSYDLTNKVKLKEAVDLWLLNRNELV